MLKEQILQLRSQGKTYNEIKNILNCSKGTIAYYCSEGQKQKTQNRQIINRAKAHPFKKKIESFSYSYEPPIIKQPIHHSRKILELKVQCFARIKGNPMYQKPEFTVDDVLAKVSENPVCYLTGKPLDISKPRTYQFDHRIPRSRGGDNSLDNLEIASIEANTAKSDMTPDEFINLCKSVLEHNGYKVEKAPDSRLERETPC